MTRRSWLATLSSRRSRPAWVTVGCAFFLLMALCGPAGAEQGVYLTWNDCARSSSASADFGAPCSSDGDQSLYCAFMLAQPLYSVVAVEIVVDVQHSDTVLPPWWQFGPGGCREGSLSARADFQGNSTCADFWHGQATLNGLSGYFVNEPRGGMNQARIRMAFAVLPALHQSLSADTMYYAARVVFGNDRTGSCPGCQAPACLVLNSILIGRLPGAPGGDLVLDQPGAQGSNQATWHGQGADCAAVPVKAHTWGALKSLYRGRS